MTPPPEVVECAKCACWFTAASLDEFFFHATSGCCRETTVPVPSIRDVADDGSSL